MYSCSCDNCSTACKKAQTTFLSIKESADPIFIPPYFRERNVRGKKTYTLFRRGGGERIPPRQYYTSCWCFSCFLFSFSFSSASPPPLCATYMGACEMTLLRLINQQSPALASPFIKSYMGGETPCRIRSVCKERCDFITGLRCPAGECQSFLKTKESFFSCTLPGICVWTYVCTFEFVQASWDMETRPSFLHFGRWKLALSARVSSRASFAFDRTPIRTMGQGASGPLLKKHPTAPALIFFSFLSSTFFHTA